MPDAQEDVLAFTHPHEEEPQQRPGFKIEGLSRRREQQALQFEPQNADAPLCSECGGMMTRNGSCYKCENCGGTSGCS